MPGSDQLGLEERLRRLPAALAVEPAPGLLEGVARRGRRRRRLRRASAAAAVVALLAGALATRSAVLDHDASQVLDPGQVRDAPAARLARGHALALPADPVAERLPTAATAWTGRELVVWGGIGDDLVVHADGAAYDPHSERWRALPPAPQRQFLEEGNGSAVWTGQELLIWGGMTPVSGTRRVGSLRRGDGLAYDPATRSWRRLASPPRQLQPLARPATWTGRELLVVDADADHQLAGGGLRGGAYDPRTGRWRLLAASPRLSAGWLLDRTVLWAGTRLLVWSFWSRPTAASRATFNAELDGADLWAYDPAADHWTVLRSPSAQVRPLLARASLAWTGQEVLAVQHNSVIQPDRALFGGRYDPDRDRWTPIATPPRRVTFRSPTALVWTGAALVADGADAYDPAADRWWRLPAPSDWAWAGQGPLLRPAGGGVITVLQPAAR